MITQDDEASTATAPSIKEDQKKHSISPRTVGIVVTALQQFMRNAFIEEMRKTIGIYDVPFDPEEMTNGAVHPVTKETLTKYK